MRASDVPRATEPSLSTALRLRLSHRRKSTRRHWPRASLRRMQQPSQPQRPAGLSCLTSCGRQAAAFFPRRVGCPTAGGSQSNGAHALTARCTLLRPRQSSTHFVLAHAPKPSDTLIILTYFDAPTTRANWTETFLPALKRPLPTSRGGWRGLRRLWWWTGCLDSSYDYGHRGQREPRVRTRPRLIVWGSVDGGRFYTRSRI